MVNRFKATNERNLALTNCQKPWFEPNCASRRRAGKEDEGRARAHEPDPARGSFSSMVELTGRAGMIDQRGRLLVAALGFAGLRGASDDHARRALGKRGRR